MPLTLTSPAFADGEPMPPKYARDGENLFPPLKWGGAPERTQSYALVVEDPDAPGGTFRHCAIYNIPADREGLPQSIDTGPDRAIAFGENDFGGQAYDGPQPPEGHGVHHYHFRLAALDTPKLSLPDGAKVEHVWAEAKKHALAETEIVGTYER